MSSSASIPTDFAPAARLDPSVIQEQYQGLVSEGRITEILDSAPYVTMVTNASRQIIYANSLLREMLDMDADGILGHRPGELLGCPNAFTHPGGCGTSLKCRFCGVVHVLLEAIESDRRIVKEARMFIRQDDMFLPFDVKVTATPMIVAGDMFLVVFMDDISSEKKRERLEKTFFHDVMNTAGGMKNLAMYLAETSGSTLGKASQLLIDQSDLLIDEIRSQRLLVEAETDKLAVNPQDTTALVLFTETRTAAEVLKEATGKTVQSVIDGDDRRMRIDSVLAKRALLNALKNAFEATRKGGFITFGMEVTDDSVIFVVENDSVMDEAVRSQVYQRSYSTKGSGRGIGTYSMRLLVEHYLCGHVSFTSTEADGTRFRIRLPLKGPLDS